MTTKRSVLSKKLRFDVFKRDGFVCQYCGAHPPAVTLEIDHIKPLADDGTSDIDNLITACFDCNRGKAARLLTAIPASVTEKAAVIAEREQQIAEYNKVLALKRVRIEKEINTVEGVFQYRFDDRAFTESMRESVRQKFLPLLPFDDVVSAMQLAIERVPDDPDGAIRYFCAVCWNQIRQAR